MYMYLDQESFARALLLESDDEKIVDLDEKEHFCVKYEKHIYCMFFTLIIILIGLFIFANIYSINNI